jgi:C4-dicarboxylate-binding protein DctP
MKKIISILLVLMMIISMAACSKDTSTDAPNSSDTSNSEDKVYKIRIAHVLQETTPSHIMFTEGFKPYVEEKSNGRIQVEVYANSSLGGERQTYEACQLGTIEVSYGTTAVLANFDPKFKIFDLPFLFDDVETARKALDGELGDSVKADLDKVKLKVLSYPENGYRMVTNSKGPIYTPADMKGLKIRTMENPIHMRAFELMGASPTPMAFSELYTGLQQGTVDAQENPIFLTYSSKFFEVQDYMSLTGHFYAPGAITIGLDFWNSLPEDLQDIVQEGANIARDLQREMLDEQNQKDLEELKKEMEVNDLTKEQKAEFAKATQPIYDELAKELGQDLVDLALKSAGKK